MGAVAFLMADFLERPYQDIVIAALVPSLLYYVGLFIQADLEAAKGGIRRVPADLIPRTAAVLATGWVFIIPFAALIWALFTLNWEPETAAILASGTVLLVAFYLLSVGHIQSRTDSSFPDTRAVLPVAALLVAPALVPVWGPVRGRHPVVADGHRPQRRRCHIGLFPGRACHHDRRGGRRWCDTDGRAGGLPALPGPPLSPAASCLSGCRCFCLPGARGRRLYLPEPCPVPDAGRPRLGVS